MNSFYSPSELSELGLKCYGKNVQVSRKASIYHAECIEIGSNVRIDDFCILSGHIRLGDYIHVAAHTSLYGGAYGIEMEDFSGVSSHCAVYAESDDYSGDFLTNPMIPAQYRGTYGKKVLIKQHALIGAGCILLPGASLEEGAAVGAMSLVTRNLPSWSFSMGIPCRTIKARSRKVLELEKDFMAKNDRNHRVQD
jgi:galactoside O-acetyltransferase